MWCFSCFRHDPSKDDDVENAKILSRYEDEDRMARRTRQEEDEQNDIVRAKEESLKLAEQEDEKRRLDDQGSNEKGKRKQVDPPHSICNGCHIPIEYGISSVNALGLLWHPLCFRCLRCHNPIATNEIPSSNDQYHRLCYKEKYPLNCYICEKKIPSTEVGERKYSAHPFWSEMYCPSHDEDGIAKCCSCERLESCRTKYVMLADGRWLCLECMECAVMDTDECVHLHVEIREFFENLNMKIEKEFPLFLVEKEALNKAQEEEKIDNQYGVVTRGICLSQEQYVTSVKQKPTMGPENKLIGLRTESQRVVRECEVTAILILYGLPRLLTGYILAHEMMHAYLRLSDYGKLNEVLEEGLCQMLGHMWLEPQTYATPDIAADSSSVSSSSRTPPATTTSKKGDPFGYEKKFVEFCMYEIETDETHVYGLGFKKVKKMMESNGYDLKETLKEIVSISKTTP